MVSKKKAQFSVEFIILISAMFFMFSIFFILINNQMVDLQVDRDIQGLEDIGETVKAEFDLALAVSPGYHREFDLPPLVEGKHYEIVVERGIAGQSGVVRYVNFSLRGEYIFGISLDINVSEADNVTVGRNCIDKTKDQIYVYGC